MRIRVAGAEPGGLAPGPGGTRGRDECDDGHEDEEAAIVDESLRRLLEHPRCKAACFPPSRGAFRVLKDLKIQVKKNEDSDDSEVRQPPQREFFVHKLNKRRRFSRTTPRRLQGEPGEAQDEEDEDPANLLRLAFEEALNRALDFLDAD